MGVFWGGSKRGIDGDAYLLRSGDGAVFLREFSFMMQSVTWLRGLD